MALYTISDLHLSTSVEKPMDIFGGNWCGYMTKIRANFEQYITDNDLVVIGGDISWGINLNEAKSDFLYLDSLPGKKIILKGNHDLWWETVRKMTNFFELNNINSINILYNNYFEYDGYAICGTRGWIFEENFKDENDRRILNREIKRLEYSFESAVKEDFNRFICFLHYPPMYKDGVCQEIIDMLKYYGVEKCVYGHLHGESLKYAKTGYIYNIEFICASADYINFVPVLIK